MDATPIEAGQVLNDGLRILARIIARDIMMKRAAAQAKNSTIVDESAEDKGPKTN